MFTFGQTMKTPVEHEPTIRARRRRPGGRRDGTSSRIRPSTEPGTSPTKAGGHRPSGSTGRAGLSQTLARPEASGSNLAKRGQGHGATDRESQERALWMASTRRSASAVHHIRPADTRRQGKAPVHCLPQTVRSGQRRSLAGEPAPVRRICVKPRPRSGARPNWSHNPRTRDRKSVGARVCPTAPAQARSHCSDPARSGMAHGGTARATASSEQGRREPHERLD
jgi:hypothetical protein